MVAKTTPQTILLSAISELYQGASGPDAVANILQRFSFLSEAQAIGYVGLAGARRNDAIKVDAARMAVEGPPVGLPLYPDDGRRFAWVRIAWIDETGNRQVRDLHVDISRSAGTSDLQEEIDRRIAEFRKTEQGRDAEGYPTRGVSGPIGSEVVGIL